MIRLSIKSTLVAIFVLFALICSVFAAVSLTSIETLFASSNRIARDSLPSVDTARSIDTDIVALRLSYSNHMTQPSAEGQRSMETEIANQTRNTLADIERYQPFVNSDEERALMATIRAGVAKYSQLGQATVAASSAHDMDGAIKAVTLQREAIAPSMEAVKALVKLNVRDAQDLVNAAEQSYEGTIGIIYAIVAAAAVLVIAAATYGLRSIASPIQVLTRSMTGLAGGDTGSDIPFTARHDELGSMANAVQVFRKGAIANARLEAEGEQARRAADADRVRIQQEAETAAGSRLQQATAGLAAGLRRLSSGDLAFNIDEAFSPDFDQLRLDLNAAVSQLGQTLSAVSGSVKTIENGTKEISNSANDLSRRTEQQAASLEETAAALDQITANVSNSSKRADEARSVAAQANTSARDSGKIVASAVDAMQRIESSSGQISNIIGVIDEIAFQTNLLALNAGVEAARAGEAGKGFAVVAQEVRELAQRSAKAAKEIKELIRNSSTEVESGVKLVSETGNALRTIEAYIVTINDHVGAIAASSREQSLGLAEVNTAVNQLDQVTQQNAAMVEENNAASVALAHEGNRLNELVGQFVLGQASSAMHARQVAGATRMTAPTPIAQRQNRLKRVAGSPAARAEDWAEF